MKALLALIILFIISFGIYWLAIKPEQIMMECNNEALGQMDSKLTYFRPNPEGENDEFLTAYEFCLESYDFEKYSTKATGERIVQILMQMREDSGLFP